MIELVNSQLSDHFTVREMICKCCNKIIVWGHLIGALEALRFYAGKPVKIVSGYRCPDYNKKVGGAKNSQHVLGYAADVTIAGYTPVQVAELARKVYDFDHGGIGIYKNFTHLDVRGKKVRWHHS